MELLKPAMLDPLWSAKQLAEHCGITVQALYNLRMSGRGPRAVRVGKYLRYRQSEVVAWEESQLEPRRS